MKSYLIIIIFFYSLNVTATAQTPDYLISGKDTLSIHTNPLDEYFKEKPIPKGLITSISSGNWRGYIAYFKFVNDRLVVENIYKEVYYDDEENDTHFSKLVSIYKEIFGDRENFQCDYFNGLLICPYGELIEYVHMGYNSLYENYKLIEIQNGLKFKEKDFTIEEYKKFKLDYYEYYKTTEAYKIESKKFKEMIIEATNSVESAIEEIDSEFDNKQANKKNKKKRENKHLKQKEAEFKAEKELESFMFLMLDDYIKTIDIPKNE